MTDPVVKVEQLGGAALERALADAMGWAYDAEDHEWTTPDGALVQDADLPPFASSLDALAAGPEKVLRDAEWLFALDYDGHEWLSAWTAPRSRGKYEFGETEALSRARSCLLALRALGEVEGERAG